MTATSAIATAAIPTAALPRHDIAVARRADAAHQRAGDRMDHDRLHRSDVVHVAKIELVPLGGEAALEQLAQHAWGEELAEHGARCIRAAEAVAGDCRLPERELPGHAELSHCEAELEQRLGC